jgi:hypothetical protein
MGLFVESLSNGGWLAGRLVPFLRAQRPAAAACAAAKATRPVPPPHRRARHGCRTASSWSARRRYANTGCRCSTPSIACRSTRCLCAVRRGWARAVAAGAHAAADALRRRWFDCAIDTAGGRQPAPVTINIAGETFAMSASGDVVDRLQRFASAKQVRSAGRKPNWFQR